MALPPIQTDIHVQAAHSCNWRCCFCCKHPTSPKTPKPSPISHTEIEEDTTHRVIKVYHSHKKELPRSKTEALKENG